jgi:SAM-dependent methyltransferase
MEDWFSKWFDSDYYHILYSHRDYNEAKAFIDALDRLFNFRPEQKALDAACGRGRHAIYLYEKGLEVTGIDLSEKSIEYAKQSARKGLDFLIHDIRYPLRKEGFDFVFNLFTSFGYFENKEDNFLAIQAFSENLMPNGYLVLDFLNTEKAVNRLVREDCKIVGGIVFHITRRIEGDFLIKEIHFEDQGKKNHFYEKVRMIRVEEFGNYFKLAGFSVEKLFGDYTLGPFDEKKSDRMIFIGKKF